MALWISTATGLTTRMALVTLMASFDSDWKNKHRLTKSQSKLRVDLALIEEIL